MSFDFKKEYKEFYICLLKKQTFPFLLSDSLKYNRRMIDSLGTILQSGGKAIPTKRRGSTKRA